MNELLTAVDVVRRFGATTALDHVNVTVRAGRSVGLAGESGSGKTTLLRQFLGLDLPTEGSVAYRGVSIDQLDREQRREYRAGVQAVFQDPGTSMDPRWPVWKSITEPITAHRKIARPALRSQAAELLRSVELSEEYIDRLHHQMSGGQSQRAAIARALATNPQIILLDEPVTALDISVRGSVLNLLRDLCVQHSTTLVVVSHDLLAVAYLTDEIHVMYRGRVVESGPTLDVIDSPQHPYTELLVRTAEDPLYVEEAVDQLFSDVGSGCHYSHRCPFATDQCATEPDLLSSGPDRSVACFHPRERASTPVGTPIRVAGELT